MAEKFSFFDPFLQDGVYDREYNAQDFTNYFKALVTTGVMRAVGSQLAVSANGTNMATTVSDGIAYILGRYYENTSTVEHIHDTESLGNTRIDRIIIRMSLEPHDRSVVSAIKKGVASTNPAPPALVQNDNIYEISLAQVRITGGQTFIATDAVTSERGIDVICPWAGSNILPSFDDNALAEHINNLNMHLSPQDRVDLNSTFYRYGINCQTITDWNSALQNGMYMGDNAANAPQGSWMMGNVTAHHSGWVRQEVYGFNDDRRIEYVRYKLGEDTNWTPWNISNKQILGGEYRASIEQIVQSVSRYHEVYMFPVGFIPHDAPSDLYSSNKELFLEVFSGGVNGVRKKVIVHEYHNGKKFERNWFDDHWLGDWYVAADYDTLFRYVSDGKYYIANAITQKGVPASQDEEFAILGSKILQIQTGRKEARGTVTAFASGIDRLVSIQGLNFRPKIALLARSTGPVETLAFRTVYVDGSTFSPAAGNINQYGYDNPNTEPPINILSGSLVGITDNSIDLIVAKNVANLDPNLTFSYIVLG